MTPYQTFAFATLFFTVGVFGFRYSGLIAGACRILIVSVLITTLGYICLFFLSYRPGYWWHMAVVHFELLGHVGLFLAALFIGSLFGIKFKKAK